MKMHKIVWPAIMDTFPLNCFFVVVASLFSSFFITFLYISEQEPLVFIFVSLQLCTVIMNKGIGWKCSNNIIVFVIGYMEKGLGGFKKLCFLRRAPRWLESFLLSSLKS